MASSSAGAGTDDAGIPFPEHPIRVSNCENFQNRGNFESIGEETHAYAPAGADAPTEHLLFPNCRRTGQ
ncbi:hypothetical protein ACIRF8_22395 [Streptomyces sp. NPDC102406]|uniref:hypothetical protein n=1 Tax=Streptomyces sp. NPDC102406 TaxID=3366171 RepID=UPI00380E3796